MLVLNDIDVKPKLKGNILMKEREDPLPAVIVRNLTKVFGCKVAIQNLSFDVKWGEIFGLLGPNGSGKTTTIRILKGIIPPTAGTALVGGHELSQKEIIKRMTGFLPENPSVYERLTALEFLEFIGLLYGVKEKVLRSRIKNYLELFDLWDRKDDLLSEYSRGMRQLVLLGSSLLHNPKILFLDEPIISLDVKAAYLVKQLIRRLARQGKAIILTSHWMDLAEHLCNRIGLLVDGELHYVGTTSELKQMTKSQVLEEAVMKMIYGKISLERIELMFNSD